MDTPSTDRLRAALVARDAAWARFDAAFSAGENVRDQAEAVQAAEAEHVAARDALLAELHAGTPAARAFAAGDS